MSFHHTAVCIVFWWRPAVIYLISSGMWHFSLAALKIISSSLCFSILTKICLGVNFFLFICLEIMEFLEYLSWCFSSNLRNLDYLKFVFYHTLFSFLYSNYTYIRPFDMFCIPPKAMFIWLQSLFLCVLQIEYFFIDLSLISLTLYSAIFNLILIPPDEFFRLL